MKRSFSGKERRSTTTCDKMMVSKFTKIESKSTFRCNRAKFIVLES